MDGERGAALPMAALSLAIVSTLAVGLAMLAFFFLPLDQGTTPHWLFTGLAGIIGYLAPSLYIDNRIKKRKAEHQSGFPDFMDLLVVCADSGLSMEASLERVGRELGDSYPSLCANIHMSNLEIRAGRSMTEALEHLGDRLGLNEAADDFFVGSGLVLRF